MLSAVIGGAIGTVLGFIIGQAARITEARGEVKLHDRQAAERNEQLRIWVDDETQSLVRELAAATERHAADGKLNSSFHRGDLAFRKAGALHRYRDEEANARLYIATLLDAEGVWHRRWRSWLKLPPPELTAVADVEPFLDRWREPVVSGGAGPEDAAAVLDRTTRTFDDARAELPKWKLT